jgi:hypothetical protein
MAHYWAPRSTHGCKLCRGRATCRNKVRLHRHHRIVYPPSLTREVQRCRGWSIPCLFLFVRRGAGAG